MSYTPSPEQEAFYNTLRSTTSSLMLDAVAGSGKTSTIVHGATLLPRSSLVKFMAFNKSIVEELRTRLPQHCQTTTFHADGYAAWRRFAGKVKVDGDKVRRILRELIPESDSGCFGPVGRLVGLAKNSGLGTHLADASADNFRELISWHNLDIDEEDPADVVRYAQAALQRSNAQREVIDFDDMLYLPLLHRCNFDKCNVIFIDESQDTNGVQRALLTQMLAAPPYGRLVAVGDPNQAIYGFRGADPDAMVLLQKQFNCVRMPLSVSWRCSKAVVKEAQRFCKN